MVITKHISKNNNCRNPSRLLEVMHLLIQPHLVLLILLILCTFTATSRAIDSIEETENSANLLQVDVKNSKVTISIHSGNSWIGVSKDNILSICKIGREKMKIGAFKQINLDPKEVEILRRFVLIKGVLKHQKENQALGEQQAELVKEDMPDASETTERIKKTTHIKLWINDQLRQVVLINDPKAREVWPEDLKYLLKLLSNVSKKTKPVEIEGAGFTQSLDHYKDPKTKWKDWAQLYSKQEEFHSINDAELNKCPENLQQMISFPSFVVPLTKEDLKLMTDLGWTEIPDDPEAPEALNNAPKRKESPFDIWWGIISYKNKTFGINAWQSENSESVSSYNAYPTSEAAPMEDSE